MTKRIIGKSSGATVSDDGSIVLAPMYADEFHAISRRERSLKNIQTVTLKFVSNALEEVYHDNSRLWKRIGTDLSLDFNNNTYSAQLSGSDHVRIIVEPLPTPDKKPVAAPEPQPGSAQADAGGEGGDAL